MIHLKHTRLAAVLTLLLFISLRSPATITVVSDYRLGESEASATPGVAAVTSLDYVGSKTLTFHGTATYSGDVNFAAALRVGSLLSVNFTNGAYATNTIVSTAVDNFGIEAWVKPMSTNDATVFYNGRTDTSGWGVTIGSGRYNILYGGVQIIPGPVIELGVWAHVALVRSNGTSTLYVHAAPVATSSSTPNIPTGNFGLAAPPQSPTSQNFSGLIDEVRVFTFNPAQFNPTDLLANVPVEPVTPLPATQITSTNATLSAGINPLGLNTAGWLEWGLTTRYGNSNSPVSVGNGQGPVQISAPITGLLPGHAYHFRATATNSSGIFRSWDKTFVTPIINLTSTNSTTYVHVPLTNSAALAATPLLLSANDGQNGIVLKADGTVSVWGNNTFGQTNFANGLSNILSVAAGDFHFVALKRDGTVVSWGKDTVGQSDTPPGLDNIAFVAAGGDYSMAVHRDGSVVTWGNPLSFGSTNIVQISASLGSVAALTADGSIPDALPPASATNIIAIACGAGHVMVLRADGNVVAWGNNGNSQTNVPPGVTNVAAISACGNGSLALMKDGSVIAWGSNDGNKDTVPPSVTNVVAIAAAGAANFAMRADGVVIGWGDPSGNQTSVPAGLTNITGVINISGMNTNTPGSYPLTYTTTNYLGAMNSATGLVTVLVPSLTFTPGVASTATVSWPTNAAGYTLEQNTSLNPNGWTPAPSGLTNPLTISTTNTALFYRLTHP